MRLLVVFAGFLAYIVVVLILSACYSTRAKLTGFDALALPANSVALLAKLENDGLAFLNPDLQGVEVEFLYLGPDEKLPDLSRRDDAKEGDLPGGQPLGVQATDEDGLARLETRAPQEPGNHFYRVRLKDSERLRLKNPVVYLMVSVAPTDHPILITDIDNTICRTSVSDVLLDRPENVAPLEHARDVLVEASKSYGIVYLTARPADLSHRTRNWLAYHGFPPGPIFFRDLWGEWRDFNFRESEYKSRFIRESILSRWKNVEWGIGNKPKDAEAYGKNKIPAIIVGVDASSDRKEYEGYGKQVHPVPDWESVGALIRRP